MVMSPFLILLLCSVTSQAVGRGLIEPTALATPQCGVLPKSLLGVGATAPSPGDPTPAPSGTHADRSVEFFDCFARARLKAPIGVHPWSHAFAIDIPINGY